MLHVHSSNRVETLAEGLGRLLEEPLADPLQTEVILVHSHGIERWLSLQLASSLGVCANITFPFPIPFLTELMLANTPGWDASRAALLDEESLVWSLLDILPQVAARPGAEPLAGFLQQDDATADIRLYQLAQCLGRLFDRYQLYRPQLLQRWLIGRLLEEETWQAMVWQALIERTGPYHRFALKNAFQQHLRQHSPEQLTGLPSRMALFGISSLAPFFVDVITALAPYSELHLFFLNPCQEYWGDILSRKQRARLSRRGGQDFSGDQLELGLSSEPDFENELLAYFGKMGRDFFDLLIDTEAAEHQEAFVDPPGQTALAALQSDILQLREGQGNIVDEAETAHPSLQVHNCHSRLREIEVLNDLLLDLFEKDPSLTPRDVVVMAPRIEEYASKIHAVFNRPTSDERFIPFDIADRTPRLSHTMASAFVRLLTLATTRWEVSEVLGVLECGPVMQRFGLTEGALEQVRHWIAASGVRWGRDASAKADLHLPEIHENTWEFGLDRLLLGYAMPTGGQAVFEGVLPYDHVEGSDLEVLNKFFTFWDHLRGLSQQVEGEHTASRWAQIGRQIIGQFFADDPIYDRELSFLYQTFNELEAATDAAGFTGKLSLAVLRAVLEERLDDYRASGGFFTGGVTFCNVLPMRSIPFRIVVLLGMSAQEFPRPDRQFAFDLMRERPVRGDRSRKHEDRYMFLEALLAARDHFLILYTGQSLKDNSEMSPSIFVTQVRDYLERVYHIPPDRYSVSHRLQPFSPVYFNPDSPWRTFAREYLDPVPDSGRHEPLTVIDSREMEDSLDTANVLSLDDLIRFLQHPVAAFYQNKFNLYPPRAEEEITDVEPVDLNALESWHLDQWILELVEAEVPTHEIGALLKASGLLPHGAHGESEMNRLLTGVNMFKEEMAEFLGGPARQPVKIDLQVGEWHLMGELRGIRPQGLRRVRFGRLRPQERYQLWVEHLVIQSLSSEPKLTSAYLGRGSHLALHEFNTPQAALHELRQLVELRARGLQRPLPLFPRSSMAYAMHRKKRKTPGECRSKAYEEWRGRNQKIPEENDFYHQLAFRDQDEPLDTEFSELSEKAVRPLLDCQK